MNDVQIHPLYIHGQYVNATSGVSFDSINPANGKVIATIQQASQQDIEKAVQNVLLKGLRTQDIKMSNEVAISTKEMGLAVIG